MLDDFNCNVEQTVLQGKVHISHHRQNGASYCTLKKYWVVLTQFWVKYGQTQTLG